MENVVVVNDVELAEFGTAVDEISTFESVVPIVVDCVLNLVEDENVDDDDAAVVVVDVDACAVVVTVDPLSVT